MVASIRTNRMEHLQVPAPMSDLHEQSTSGVLPDQSNPPSSLHTMASNPYGTRIPHPQDPSSSTDNVPSAPHAPSTTVSTTPPLHISFADVHDPVLVAEGAAAKVYRGLLHQPSPHELPPVLVAMRRPRITSIAALHRFEQEVALRATLHHPNILPLLAVSATPPHYCTVSPWMHGGDLFHALHVRTHRLRFPRVLALALQIADAMRYLHLEKRVVHRDLKSANILLDHPNQPTAAVVADLDLAVHIHRLSDQSADNQLHGRDMHRGPSNGRLAHMVGTLVYMAPEVLQGSPHHFPADVYAFAIVINEMAAAAVPFVDRKLPVPELHTILETRFNEVTLRSAIVKDNLRPVLASGVPQSFLDIITASWLPNPTSRPSFDTICHLLQAIANPGPDYLAQFDCSAQNPTGLKSDSGRLVELPQTLQLQFQEFNVETIPSPAWCVEEGQRPPHHASAPCLSVWADISSTSGRRGSDRMEDRSFVHLNIGDVQGTHLLGVFDGHGGDSCAQFVQDHFPSMLCRAWARSGATPTSSLVQAFKETNAAFLGVYPLTEESGCTALVVLFIDSVLFVANAGDCRCIMGLADGTCMVLTTDHLASAPEERGRVEAAGGYVDHASSRLQGRLLVSRALGDRSLANFLTPEPDVGTITLTPEHDFIILASDGLWDVVSSAEAVALVRTTVRCADLAAKRLALKAMELGSDDNITVIVAFLDWHPA